MLKRDHFGAVLLVPGGEPLIARDTGCATPWLRWLAQAMARREDLRHLPQERELR